MNAGDRRCVLVYATAWAAYQIRVVLPAGSAPGTWGLESLTLADKADNVAAH